MFTIVSWLTQKLFLHWSRAIFLSQVLVDPIVAQAEAPRSHRGSRRLSFMLVTWSRLSVFHMGYEVSHATLLIATWPHPMYN